MTCIGERFEFSEIGENKEFNFSKQQASLKYYDMLGWPILQGLCDVILYYRPYSIVEIGAGKSTPILARAAERAGVKLHTCDKKFAKVNTFFNGHLFYQMMSDEFMKRFDDVPIAIALIDGDHHYEQAKKEFDFCWERLCSGGVIFLHDTYPPHERMLELISCGDIYKLRQELEQRHDEMDCFTWPYSANWDGLTMVIKKEKERPYWGK